MLGHMITTVPRSASALSQACPTIVMHSSSNRDYKASWDASYTPHSFTVLSFKGRYMTHHSWHNSSKCSQA